MDTPDTRTQGHKGHKEGGNTTTPSPKKRKTRSRKWAFTINNYDKDEVEKLIEKMESKECKYIVGFEVGKLGTPHIQGYIEFKNPRTFTTLKNFIEQGAHIEKANGSAEQNYDYCSKEGNYRTNMQKKMTRQDLVDEVLKEYKDVKWRDWQLEVLKICDEKKRDRKINWFWEEHGNAGKTYLAKYLACTRNIIICDGKKADIFNQVNMVIEAGKKPELILLDIPRSSKDFINYGVLEKLKDGFLYSGKYEGGMCIFPSPTVIAFANEEPEIDKMSKDRWNIINIDNKDNNSDWEL